VVVYFRFSSISSVPFCYLNTHLAKLLSRDWIDIVLVKSLELGSSRNHYSRVRPCLDIQLN
jgi:hypothetical protein